MAFAETNLSKISNAKPPAGTNLERQIWHFEAGADAVATVVTAGYFNEARDLLQVGDRIHVVAATESAFRVLKVTAAPKSPATGNVTVSALAFS